MTQDFLRSVHNCKKPRVDKHISSVISPRKTEVPVAENVSSCTDEVDDDNVALETSLRFLRGGPQTWTLKLFDVELSAPAEARINAALTRLLDGEEANEVVAQIQPPFSASVSRQSLQTLKSGERLNDEVMNFFIRKHNLYAARYARLERHPAPVVKCTNSFFFTKLEQQGYSAVKAWSAASTRLNTHAWLESKCVFVPINRGCAHWMCAVVDVCGRVIYMIDSYNSYYSHLGVKLLDWICEDV